MPSTWKKPLILLAVLAAIPFFFIGGPSYGDSRSFSAAWNLGHILFFALVTSLLCPHLATTGERGGSALFLLRIFFGILFLGIIIELSQMASNGRHPDPFDLLRNQLGCLCAGAFFCQRQRPTPRRLFFKIFVIIALAIAAAPLLAGVTDEILARCQFPLLADFETFHEETRWVDQRQIAIERSIVRHGKKSLRVKLSTATYSGVSLFYFPRNWSGYQWLHFSVYNPLARALPLHCRIHDALHKKYLKRDNDLFYQRLVLQPGWNDLRVSLRDVQNAPAGRKMDMEHIERVGFFVIRQLQPLTIYLDHVYLGN